MSISIECLPTEMLQAIFANCAIYQLKTISEVCHRWADAVQLLLLKQTYLNVCESEKVDRIRMWTIDKRILLKSNRKYTGLDLEWRNGETDRFLGMLKELCDLCQERFQIQRLHLKAPPNETLVQFFSDRQAWLKNLTELSVKLKQLGRTKSVDPQDCEILLPNLKKLHCIKSRYDANLQGGPYEGSYAFTLNAPELCWLKVEMSDEDECSMESTPESRFLEQNVCCLFLPKLKLKTSPKLVNVVMEGITEINQRHVDNSEDLFKNWTVLEMEWCSVETAEQIWRKCPNLKEFIFRTCSTVFLHISPAMALSLEKLTIEGCPLGLDVQTVFPKLTNFSLDLALTEDRNNSIHLVAPQLTTLTAVCMGSSQLIVHHKEQIRTMEVTFGDWIMNTNPPPPYVTELILQWPYVLDSEVNLVQDYLIYFPNLQRLKLYGLFQLYPVDLREMKIIPNLKLFSARMLTLRLTDFRKFAGLKSLVLSQCVIKMEPDDEQVVLRALEYCRVDCVAIDGCCKEEHFPIRVDERQPPIEMLKVTAKGRHVFNSREGGEQHPYNTLFIPEQF